MGYHLTEPVVEVGGYGEMADDQQFAANLGSSSFVERMTAKGLLASLKGKRHEPARKAAEEEQVECMVAPWMMAGNLAVKVVVVVDRVIRALYYCNLLLGRCQIEVTRGYHVADHTAVVVEGAVG